MRRVTNIASFFLLICLTNVVWAQFPASGTLMDETLGPQWEYTVTRWNTRDGLPQNSITSIFKSKLGDLWLTTYGGIVQFNGKDFRVFSVNSTPSIPHIRFNNGVEGLNGSLWFVSVDRVVMRYENNTFTPFELPITDDYSLTNAVLYKGQLLVGTREFGIWRFTGDGFTPWKTNLDNQSLSIGPRGNLWVFSNTGITKVSSRGRTIKLDAIENSDYFVVHWFAQDSALIASNAFLYRLGKNGVKKIVNKPLDFRITAFVQYRDKLLVGTNRGLFELNEEDELVPSPYGKMILSAGFSSFWTDHGGNLWVGTGGDGLYKLTPKYTSTWGYGPNLLRESTSGVLVNSKGEVFGSYYCRGIVQFDGTYWMTLPNSENLCVNAMVELDPDNLLFTTFEGGIYQYNLQTSALKNIRPNDLRAMSPYAILRQGNNFLVGHRNGLGELQMDGSYQKIYSDYLGMDAQVRVLYRDQSNRIWVGHNKGVGYLNHGRFTPIIESLGYKNLPIRSVLQDASGDFWFGSNGYGLYFMHEGKVHEINKLDPNLPEVVSSLVEHEGYLWMTSNNGLWIMNLEEARKRILRGSTDLEAWKIGTDAGLSSTEFNGGFQNHYAMDSTGIMWFTGIRGLVQVDPKKLLKPLEIPLPSFRNFWADDALLPNDGDLTIDHSTRRLEISFNLPYFSEPSNVETEYRLLGLDDTWRECQELNVTYSKLPPGTYTFQLRVSNRFNRNQYHQIEKNFLVPNPFYQRTSFYLVLISILSLGAYLGYRYRINNTRKLNQRLKALVRDRTRSLERNIAELEENQKELLQTNFMRSKVMSILTHNVKGPLKYLQHLSGLVNEKWDELSPAELKESNATILKTAEALNQMVMDILQWSRIQSGNLPQGKELYNLSDRMERDLAILGPLAKRKELHLINNLPSDLEVATDANTLSLIFQNLISNSIKFTRRGGQILIEGEKKGKQLCIKVIDNGVGIREEDRPKLFDPNSHISLPGTENEQGTGLGLLIVSDLVQKLNGTIEAIDRPEGGTIMCVKLPVL